MCIAGLGSDILCVISFDGLEIRLRVVLRNVEAGSVRDLVVDRFGRHSATTEDRFVSDRANTSTVVEVQSAVRRNTGHFKLHMNLCVRIRVRLLVWR